MLIKREWRIEAGTPKKIFLSVTQYRFLVPLQCGLSLGWGKSALHMRGGKNLVTIKCYLSWKSSPKLPEYCQIQRNLERSPYFQKGLLDWISLSHLALGLLLQECLEQDSNLCPGRMLVFEDCQATTLTTQPPWLNSDYKNIESDGLLFKSFLRSLKSRGRVIYQRKKTEPSVL